MSDSFLTDAFRHLDTSLLKVSPFEMGLIHPSFFSADKD